MHVRTAYVEVKVCVCVCEERIYLCALVLNSRWSLEEVPCSKLNKGNRSC